MLDRYRKPAGDARVSDLDRQRAEARAEELAAEGRIRGDEELQLRLRRVRLAINQRDLDVAFEGLDIGDRQLKGAHLRASKADRKGALRRLDMHESLGHLEPQEASARRELAEASRTPHDIAKLFMDLPALPADSPRTERRISEQDRDDGVALLKEACAEGRIDAEELAAAEAQVRSARTRNEINAAFRGLSSPSVAAAAKTTSNVAKQTADLTTRVVAEGGRRAKRAFLRVVLATAAAMIGVILLIAGSGTVALICFVGAVLLFVSAATALMASQSSA